MVVDYKKRCVKDMVVDGVPCQIIRYGVDAEEANYDVNDYPVWTPYGESYKGLSNGGRRPGNPIEEEWKRRKHFYNKRILTDEESTAGHVRRSGYRDSILAQDPRGSVESPAWFGVPRANLGSGAGDATDNVQVEESRTEEEGNSNEE